MAGKPVSKKPGNPRLKPGRTPLLLLLLLILCGACRVAPGEIEDLDQDNPEIPTVGSAAGSEAAAFDCPAKIPDWVVGMEPRRAGPQPEPAPRTAYVDPTYGTCVIRVTDRATDPEDNDPSPGLKNEYSRVQSFNADGSLLLLRSLEANWYLYDARVLEPLAQLPLGVDPRWDPLEPLRIYSIDGTRLLATDLRAGLQTVVHDFQEDFPGRPLAAVWTRYEGSPSVDGNTWGFLVQDEDWQSIALLVYDRPSDRVIAVRELPQQLEIDSVTISPLGRYLLVYHDEICAPGRRVDDRNPCGLMVYDRDLEQVRNLLPVVGHSDTALDGNGREVLIFQDIQQDEISMLDLESGAITPLLEIDFSHSPLGFHFSGRALSVPGWALVSTHEGARPAATWMDDVIFALELKPGGRVVRLASTYSIVDSRQEHDYWAEPHASVNPDFTRVVFTSNWGRSGTGAVDTYMIVLPDDWLNTLP
ncbi:MAG: hypothetical protein ACK2TX_13950 [Anaerolineales bacterium]